MCGYTGQSHLSTPETGMAILRALAGGERDARKLAQLRDPHCQNSEKEIADQLTGHWREDHLFSLKQALKMYDALQEGIGEYEAEILRQRKELEKEECHGQPAPGVKNPVKTRSIRRRGQEPMREALFRMSGVDLTTIDAIGVETVQVVLTEYGPDLSCFPTEKQFVSQATLAPRRPTSGGKPLKKKSATARAPELQPRFEWRHYPNATARLRWGLITATSRPESGAM